MIPIIDAEARGAVRVFKAGLARAAARFNQNFDARGATRDAERLAHAGAVGGARALARLTARFGPPDRILDRHAIWSMLKPRDAVVVVPRDVGQTQNAVVVDYIVAGHTGNGAYLRTGLWTLEVPDHALGRLSQRARGVDLDDAIRQAHRELLAAGFERLPSPYDDLLVRAGPGAFVGQLVYGHDVKTGDVSIYFRPRTWLHEDMIGEEQVPIAPGTPPLGESLMLPVPLRDLRIEGSRVIVNPIMDKPKRKQHD